MATLDFLKDIKDLKKTELWGVIIVAALDLIAITTALSNIEKIGVGYFFILFCLLQACSIPLCIKLFRLYEARLGVDDMHEAARNTHITMEKINELTRTAPELQKTALQALEALRLETEKKTEACKNLTSCPFLENKDHAALTPPSS